MPFALALTLADFTRTTMSWVLFGKGGMGSHYLSSFLANTNGVGVRLLGPHLRLGHHITLVSHTLRSP